MTTHNFGNIDKYQEDQELRDRIRVVIRGLIAASANHGNRYMLDNILAKLQPTASGTNEIRIEIGVNHHWENKLCSVLPDKEECVLVLLRQLLINWWDYLLEGSDESLKSDGRIENHLETLENYVKYGLENYVVTGDVRNGYFLMCKKEYHEAMEDVR